MSEGWRGKLRRRQDWRRLSRVKRRLWERKEGLLVVSDPYRTSLFSANILRSRSRCLRMMQYVRKGI